GEHRAEVRPAPCGGRVEYPQPDVDPPVAEPEDPPVPGQQLVAALLAAQLQPGFQVVVVVPGRRVVVPPHRTPDRPVLALGHAQRQREPGGHAVGGEHQRRGEAALVAIDLRGHPDHPAGRVEDRPGHVVPGQQLRPGALRVPRQKLVEIQPGPGEPVVRETGQVRPVQLHPDAAAEDAQALVVQPARARAGVDTHPHELLDSARGQPVAADLLRGNSVFSSTSTVRPCLARWYAADEPPGPAPTTMTSASRVSATTITASSSQLVKQFTSRPAASLKPLPGGGDRGGTALERRSSINGCTLPLLPLPRL